MEKKKKDIPTLEELTYEQFRTYVMDEGIMQKHPNLRDRLLLSTPQTNTGYDMSVKMTYESVSTYGRSSAGPNEWLNPMSHYMAGSDLYKMPQDNVVRQKIAGFIHRILSEEWKNIDIPVKINFLQFIQRCMFFDDKTLSLLINMAAEYRKNDSTRYCAARANLIYGFCQRTGEGYKYEKLLDAEDLILASDETVMGQFILNYYACLIWIIHNLAKERLKVQLGLTELII